jgi:hypothetical protein
MLRIATAIAPARASKISATSALRPAAHHARGFAIEGIPSFREREKSLEDEAIRRHEKELQAERKKKAEEGKYFAY